VGMMTAPVVGFLADKFRGGDKERIRKGIEEGIDPLETIREQNRLAEEQNPWSYLGGQVAGGISTAAIPGGALGTVAKTASLGQKALQLGKGVTAATGYGAIEGAGLEEEGSRGEGFKRGGLTGLATGTALPIIGKVLKPIGRVLRGLLRKRWKD